MKILKWTAISLGGFILLFSSLYVMVFILSELRINHNYIEPAEAIKIPSDSESVSEGKRLFISRGCSDCHGNNLAGKIFIDDALIGTLAGSNLTSGKGGIREYKDSDFVRAIRHGIAPDNKPLIYMPSHEYYALNDLQLSAIIAYIRSAPPVNNQPPLQIGPLMRIWFLANKVPLLSAEIIDHQAQRPLPVTTGETVAYGRYLANNCMGCHRKDFTGGAVPGAPAALPKASNITHDPVKGIGRWKEADFIKAMRLGIRPNGSTINAFMPWKNFSQMTSLEIKALWLYLQTVPGASELHDQ